MEEALGALALKALQEAGIRDGELQHAGSRNPRGDGVVVVRVGTLLLRICRDRGQVFLDLGSVHSPDEFHQFDDVEIGMGWRSVASVLAKQEPEPLDTILSRLRERWSELESQMSAAHEPKTRERILRAARERAKAFESILR